MKSHEDADEDHVFLNSSGQRFFPVTRAILWFNPSILLYFLFFCFLSIRPVDVGHLKLRLHSRAQGLEPGLEEAEPVAEGQSLSSQSKK